MPDELVPKPRVSVPSALTWPVSTRELVFRGV